MSVVQLLRDYCTKGVHRKRCRGILTLDMLGRKKHRGAGRVIFS